MHCVDREIEKTCPHLFPPLDCLHRSLESLTSIAAPHLRRSEAWSFVLECLKTAGFLHFFVGVAESRLEGACYAGSSRLKVALANVPKVPSLSHETWFDIGLRNY